MHTQRASGFTETLLEAPQNKAVHVQLLTVSPLCVLSKSSLGLKPLRKSNAFTDKWFTFQISLCGTFLQDLTLCTNTLLFCDVTAALLHPAVHRFTS